MYAVRIYNVKLLPPLLFLRGIALLLYVSWLVLIHEQLYGSEVYLFQPCQALKSALTLVKQTGLQVPNIIGGSVWHIWHQTMCHVSDMEPESETL